MTNRARLRLLLLLLPLLPLLVGRLTSFEEELGGSRTINPGQAAGAKGRQSMDRLTNELGQPRFEVGRKKEPLLRRLNHLRQLERSRVDRRKVTEPKESKNCRHSLNVDVVLRVTVCDQPLQIVVDGPGVAVVAMPTALEEGAHVSAVQLDFRQALKIKMKLFSGMG